MQTTKICPKCDTVIYSNLPHQCRMIFELCRFCKCFMAPQDLSQHQTVCEYQKAISSSSVSNPALSQNYSQYLQNQPIRLYDQIENSQARKRGRAYARVMFNRKRREEDRILKEKMMFEERKDRKKINYIDPYPYREQKADGYKRVEDRRIYEQQRKEDPNEIQKKHTQSSHIQDERNFIEKIQRQESVESKRAGKRIEGTEENSWLRIEDEQSGAIGEGYIYLDEEEQIALVLERSMREK